MPSNFLGSVEASQRDDQLMKTEGVKNSIMKVEPEFVRVSSYDKLMEKLCLAIEERTIESIYGRNDWKQVCAEKMQSIELLKLVSQLKTRVCTYKCVCLT